MTRWSILEVMARSALVAGLVLLSATANATEIRLPGTKKTALPKDVTTGEKRSGGDASKLVFSCSGQNDLYRVAVASGIEATRVDGPLNAVKKASVGAGVLILAEGYPGKTTQIPPAVFDLAVKKRLRLYVEYPASLPNMAVGKPKATRLERVVVVSDAFGETLRPMRIAMINGCHLVETCAAKSHLVAAKVAGVDEAVFGLKDTPHFPILFEHPGGSVLVGTTKLSHFVTGRYMPQDAWAAIFKMVLAWLQPGRSVPELRWTPTVRPSYSAKDALPADVELQALRRAADWFGTARILRHPDWPKQALDWALTYNTVRDKPGDDWPVGDGSLGLVEGYSSTIRPDGSQPMRYAVRNDCMSEVAMALAFDTSIDRDRSSARIAANLLDYAYARSVLAQGPRVDPKSPSYGLVGWSLDYPNKYWGDDNARAMLAVLATAKLLDESRWNAAIARCLLANLRTTGVEGYRIQCIVDEALKRRGWESFWTGDFVLYSPHYEGWLWACFLWAYDKTGFAPFLEKSKTAIRMLMHAYPDRWYWVIRSSQIERARALLPLAWLVRVEDTPEHRRWLRTVAHDLLAAQDACGAICEMLGGAKHAVPSNAKYGTGEVTLLQRNGEPLCDSLYTCNFALIGLHEAAAATGETFYREAEDKLARFLCRIQIHSEAHPELDGAWYRGFDFRRWEYWASNADWEWGAWCTETGWGTPWIASTLALRHLKTSLWDLTQDSKIKRPLDTYRRQMLSDEAIKSLAPKLTKHAGLKKPICLTEPPDPRYRGAGAVALSDGLLGSTDYRSSRWLGYQGKDLEAVIDLGSPTDVKEVGANFLQSTGVGIFLPKRVEFAVSDDGKEFRTVATVKPKISPREPEPLTDTLSAASLKARSRYVRVRATSLRRIPAWHHAGGKGAWLFADEIMVR